MVTESQKRYRERNKELLKEKRRLYCQTSEFKEKQRGKMAEYRFKNKEKCKEIAHKSFNKNKEKYNAVRREKYKIDPEYKKKKQESGIKYKESGGRSKACKNNPKHRERAKTWAAKNPEKVKAKMREYKDKYWLAHETELRNNLDDTYVVKVIKKQTGFTLNTYEIPKDLLELKRASLKLKRELKLKQYATA